MMRVYLFKMLRKKVANKDAEKSRGILILLTNFIIFKEIKDIKYVFILSDLNYNEIRFNSLNLKL